MTRIDSRRGRSRAIEPGLALGIVALSALGALAVTVGSGAAEAPPPARPEIHAVAVKLAEPLPQPQWQQQTFATVTVLDARTLAAGDLRIALAGLALPRADEICRTIDRREEPCTTRAATQLELLTRWRKVSCRYRETAPGEAVGTCRVGEADLADRMVRTRTVRRDEQG
jgi:hypothetical protein